MQNPLLNSFGSDNHAGIHPEILKAITEANQGAAVAYGSDPWTLKAQEVLRLHFGKQSEPFIVFNGTGANVLSIAAMLRPFEAVICTEGAHIAEDEVGAPEHFTGSKLIGISSPDNKLTPELIEPRLVWVGDAHRVQPKLISITQSTEYGTVYSLSELRALVAFAKKHKLLLHIDGARLCNAAATLNVGLGELCEGFDCVSLGGTKNGLMGAEAVVFLNPAFADKMVFQRKQAMQLSSKMRFLSAQMIALFEGDLWKQNAAHANKMALLLAEKIKAIPGIELTQKVQANAIFARMKKDHITRAQKHSTFYVWKEGASHETTSEVRWMTSFATTEADIADFVKKLSL